MQEDDSFVTPRADCTPPDSAARDVASDRLTTTSRPALAYFDNAGDGPAVLFAHGVGSSAATWRELFARMGCYRLIASDMRGHGRSSVPGAPYLLADLVDDQVRVLDALGLDAVHFVGFSIGALIGQAFALAHPDRLVSLTLLSGTGARTPAERSRAAERLEVVRSSAPADVARSSVERWFTPQFVQRCASLVEDEVAIVSATNPVGYAASYEVLATNDLIDELHAITAPTLVATGENDIGSTPRMAAEIHRRIPGSRLAVLPGLRHYIHIEGSGAVAGLLTAFLDEVATDPSSDVAAGAVRDEVLGPNPDNTAQTSSGLEGDRSCTSTCGRWALRQCPQ